jgi:hypothetical protein
MKYDVFSQALSLSASAKKKRSKEGTWGGKLAVLEREDRASRHA